MVTVSDFFRSDSQCAKDRSKLSQNSFEYSRLPTGDRFDNHSELIGLNFHVEFFER